MNSLRLLRKFNLPQNAYSLELKASTGVSQQKRYMAKKKSIESEGIVWKEPKRYATYDPVVTGDLKPFECPDLLELRTQYQLIKNEIKKEDLAVQRLMSIEFAPFQDRCDLAQKIMREKLERHKYDDYSLETRIADATVKIRYLYHLTLELDKITMIRYEKVVKLIPGHIRKRIKHNLEYAHIERFNMLTKLRNFDYKRFEWLLEQLDIQYVPKLSYRKPMTREESISKLVEMHCNMIRENKMEAYKSVLEDLKKDLVQEKEETRKFIEDAENEILELQKKIEAK